MAQLLPSFLQPVDFVAELMQLVWRLWDDPLFKSRRGLVRLIPCPYYKSLKFSPVSPCPYQEYLSSNMRVLVLALIKSRNTCALFPYQNFQSLSEKSL